MVIPISRRRQKPPSRAALALAANGYRLSDLAEVAGVTEATASRWMSGSISARREELGFSLSQLVGEALASQILSLIPEVQGELAA